MFDSRRERFLTNYVSSEPSWCSVDCILGRAVDRAGGMVSGHTTIATVERGRDEARRVHLLADSVRHHRDVAEIMY